MVFKFAVIGNKCYGDEDMINTDPKVNKLKTMSSKMKRLPTFTSTKHENEFDFHSVELNKLIKDNEPGEEINFQIPSSSQPFTYKYQRDLVNDFFLSIALCNECLIERNEETGTVSYQGQSPDEVTLTQAASLLGFSFDGNTPTEKYVMDRNGNVKKYIVHKWIGFDSDRKRSSIIVEDENGVIKHYMKGADSIIFERLSAHGGQWF